MTNLTLSPERKEVAGLLWKQIEAYKSSNEFTGETKSAVLTVMKSFWADLISGIPYSELAESITTELPKDPVRFYRFEFKHCTDWVVASSLYEACLTLINYGPSEMPIEMNDCDMQEFVSNHFDKFPELTPELVERAYRDFPKHLCSTEPV